MVREKPGLATLNEICHYGTTDSVVAEKQVTFCVI